MLLSVLAVLPALGAALATRLVTQWPLGTWLENLAVRANGELLVTMLSAPEIWAVDPLTGHRALVASVTGAQGTSGIAEITPDVFAFGAGNVSLGTASPVPNTYALWLFDARTRSVRKVTDVPEASMINGLAALDAHTVASADPWLGVVHAIDTRSGARRVLTDDAALSPDPGAPVPLGVNGVRVRARWLYFTNSGRGLFGRIPLRANATVAGPAEILASDLGGPLPDDFALAPSGCAYITSNPFNEVVRVSRNGSVTSVAGSIGSLAVAGCTSAQFGRGILDRETLYVVTDGGLERPVNGTITEGGKVVAIRT